MHRDKVLVADRQSAVAGQPSERALHDPAMRPQVMLRFDPLPRDAVLDPATAARLATAQVVVALVRVELGRPASWSAAAPRPERRDGVEHRLEHPTVVQVRGSHLDGERYPLAVDHKMLLRARLALVRGVPADLAPPFFAAKLLESRAARVQSIWSAAANRSSMARWGFFHTPRRCHCRRRR